MSAVYMIFQFGFTHVEVHDFFKERGRAGVRGVAQQRVEVMFSTASFRPVRGLHESLCGALTTCVVHFSHNHS